MFAIAFDMDIKELRNSYGEPYNNAYYEIKIILRRYSFFNTMEQALAAYVRMVNQYYLL